MKTPALVAAALIPICFAFAAHAAEPKASEWFPFERGRYWVFDGTVAFVENGAVKERPVIGWRSEVTDTLANDKFRAALLKGHPADLAWFEEGKQRGEAIVIMTASGEFHELLGDKNAAMLFAAMKSSGKLPADTVGADTILFKVPPRVGDRYGDPEATKRGARYCWAVLDVSHAKLDPPVKGLSADAKLKAITLTYRTSPDHTNICFAAGVGIVSYEYVHHGTKGDCDMNLVETGTSGTPAVFPAGSKP